MFEYTLFADDTSLFSQEKNLLDLNTKINSGLIDVSDWLIANKLTLNVDKSNLLLFKPNRSDDCADFSISLDGKELRRKTFVKYLGVRIDDHLQWNEQIAYVNLKLSQGI